MLVYQMVNHDHPNLHQSSSLDSVVDIESNIFVHIIRSSHLHCNDGGIHRSMTMIRLYSLEQLLGGQGATAGWNFCVLLLLLALGRMTF